MSKLTEVILGTELKLVERLQFVSSYGYVKSQDFTEHDPLICKGINRVYSHSIKYIQNLDGELESAPKSKFNVEHVVCSTCGEIINERWEN